MSRLRAAMGSVAAEGTDPDLLGCLVAWVTRRGCQPDALRRRLLERRRSGPTLLEGESLGGVRPPWEGLAEWADTDVEAGTPAGELAALVGLPSVTDAQRAADVAEAWVAAQVRVSLVGDPAYPGRLAEGWPFTDAPLWLAARGDLADGAPSAALVGARRATGYGTGVAAWLAEAAADAGIRIVSGGAVGIDAAAHEAAIDRPGGTTVVLGCGHAVAYPRPHARPGGLFDRVVAAGGAIVSESLPADAPKAHRIRNRNRIVAALADVVVVVEGGPTSGALLTATAALDRDRIVLAVPGDVRASGSTAPHRLLAEGAAPCTAPRDLLEALGRTGEAPTGAEDAPSVPSCLPEPVLRELAVSWPRAIRVEDLALRAGLPVPPLLAALTRAKVAGEVAEGSDGIRLRRAPAAS
jgi:DNA processing protein